MKKFFSLFLAVIMAFTIIAPTNVSAASSKKVSKPKVSSVSTVSSTSVKIKWKKVSGADGYVIYQKKGDGKYLKIKTITSGKTTSYTKKSLSSATKYTYKIKAYVKVGSEKIYGEYSSAKSAYTKPLKVTVSSISAVSATSVKIKWKKVSRADGYEIYQKKASGEYKKIKTITSGETTSYTQNSLSGATKYTYKIKAYVKFGTEKIYGSYSSVKSIVTPKPTTKPTEVPEQKPIEVPEQKPPEEEEVVNLGALTQTASGDMGPEIITSISHLTGKSEFTKPTFTKAKHSSTGMEYYYYKPSAPAPADGYPVLLYLHGTGQGGDVFVSVANWWTHNFDILKDAVIIAPIWPVSSIQYNLDKNWDTSGNAVAIVKEIAEKKLSLGGSLLNIDKNRIYIAGYSAGAIGTYRELARNDGFFAAAVPMAGATTGTILNNKALKNTHIWGWHGSDDTTVSYDLDFSIFGCATKAIYNKIGSAGKMRFTTVDAGIHSAAPYSASMDRRVWSWMFAQKKGINQSLDYEITPYVKVVDSSGKIVFSELDCSAVAYDSGANKFSMTMTNAGRTKLSTAYTSSNGEAFTVYYGSKKIVTFTATQALDSIITKFVIKDVFGDNYIDENLARRVERNINKNKLSKTAINETIYGNG